MNAHTHKHIHKISCIANIFAVAVATRIPIICIESNLIYANGIEHTRILIIESTHLQRALPQNVAQMQFFREEKNSKFYHIQKMYATK